MPYPVSNIKKACESQGITIAELERELGIGNGVIRRWENAKTYPPIDRLIAISKRLKISLEEMGKFPQDTEKPAPTNGDGLTSSQKELIRLLPLLTDSEVTVLLTTVRSLIDGRILGDSQ